ncbi:uncharacterized protein LOC115925345 [Strongylocentrotus purpuratus]|uniref:Uncharacterized protein n=1 Tax=Strongylocentrotus purpuratus TaxID=7668 RepID=A0A7M7P2J0_STRPU|nr:uncharacterized protein LOC105438349 [Strongylocentrotus purpuratus]XP_030844871.1 uncharacterized protein LOC115925345 [Strongylocentrotus purpuratus]|eukprot:XP_011664365.1 PREDICTED: uncharacterized protein LOC105438349 [Strongylocentrotus purpuratus]
MPSTHQQPYLPNHVPLLESAHPSGQFQSDPHRGIQSEPEQTDQSTMHQQLSPIMSLQSTFAPDQSTKQHLEEFEQVLQSYLSAQHNASNGHATQYSLNSSSQETLQHSPHHGLGEATQDTAVSQRREDATPIEIEDTTLSSSSEYINSRTSVHHGGMSIGMKPFYENDDSLAVLSTSGLSSAQSRTDAAPVESERIPEHRKRIHSHTAKGEGDGVDESLEQRPGKRRAKTDLKPTSP